MKKIIFGLMFCAVAISSVYALDESLIAKMNEMSKKEKQLLNGNIQSAMMMGQAEQISRKYSKQCFNKKWEYCGPAHALIEVDLEMTPKGKIYEDKLNKQEKLDYFVCDELPDDVISDRLYETLMFGYIYYNRDKNYEKRDQCIRKFCSYSLRVNKDFEKKYNSVEECFKDLKASVEK